MSAHDNKKPDYDENLFLTHLPAFAFLCIGFVVMLASIIQIKPSNDPFPQPTLSQEESIALIQPVKSNSPGGAGATDGASSATIDEGLALMKKSDCLACHQEMIKVVGPAYADVAAKYKTDKNAIAKLIEKVKVGGKGVWGEMPMSPHPTLKDEEIGKMIKYILTIKGGKAPEVALAPQVSSELSPIFELMKKSDCYACHADRELKIGPSYLEVAKKYKGNADVKKIAEKIKNGGTGVWGNVPMLPHPQLSDEDIDKMVKAILSVE